MFEVILLSEYRCLLLQTPLLEPHPRGFVCCVSISVCRNTLFNNFLLDFLSDPLVVQGCVVLFPQMCEISRFPPLVSEHCDGKTRLIGFQWF